MHVHAASRPFSVASLFSGCGGLDLGFKEVGFDLAYACDSDQAAVSCFARNVDPRVHLRDVRSEAFQDDLSNLDHVDVVIGGFPCQGFSKAGPKRREDSRNTLYVEMRRAVARLLPSIFVAENVDGISQNFGGSYVSRIVDDFSSLGYHVEYRTLDAAAFGVPQRRRRVFFVGTRADLTTKFRWPTVTHLVNSRNGESKIPSQPQLWDEVTHAPIRSPRTISDAIADIIDLKAPVPDHRVTGSWPSRYESVFRAIGEGQKLCNVRHAATSIRTWDIPEVFGQVTPRERMILECIARNRRHKRYGDIPNGNPLPLDEIERLTGLSDVNRDTDVLQEKGYLKAIGEGFDLKGALFCSGMFKRPRWDEPSPTVLTNFHNPRYFLHPRADRPFSLRESARLQGFPDSFLFLDADVDLSAGYRLVGNAVPPPVSRQLAKATARTLEAVQAEVPSSA